jgi:hypothetical protein
VVVEVGESSTAQFQKHETAANRQARCELEKKAKAMPAANLRSDECYKYL